MSTRQKKYKDEDWLRTEYVEKERSLTEIADELKVSNTTISNWLDKHNIKTREPAETYTSGNTKKLRDREWLEKEYIKKEKSSIDIANELNCDKRTVLNWLEKHNIERRENYETLTGGNTNKLRDKEWLMKQYVQRGKSSCDIANEVNCSANTVRNWLHKYNVETNNYGNTQQLCDKEWLKEQYVKKEKPTHVIADELDCNDTTVARWLRNHDIETRSHYDYYQSVEDAPDHIDHGIRSGWELEIAEMLIDNDVDYEYESMEIEYGDSTYIPDFITDDYIIEVKGWIRGNDERQKATTTMEKIDDKQYVVVGSELPCDIHIDWENNSELVELFT